MSQHVARLNGRSRIDCNVSFVNVANDPVFIDHEGGAISKALLFIKDTVVFDDCAFEVAE